MNGMRKTLIGLAVALAVWGPSATAQSLSGIAEREAEIAALLDELATPDLATWEAVETKVIRLWSQSGSATIDSHQKRHSVTP